MKNIILLLSFLITLPTYAYQHLAVGQGVSAPHQGFGTFFSNGFTAENTFSAAQLNKARLTAAYAETESDTKYTGAEFAYGNGTAGFQISYLDSDCTGCDDDVKGSLGLEVAGVGVGLGFIEDLYSLGFMLNPNGEHRIGIIAESFIDSDNSSNEYTTFGVGYSYYSDQFIFALDASKLEYKSAATNDDRVIVSPGLLLPFNQFSISVTHDVNLNLPEGSTVDDETWFGFAFHPQDNFSVAVYSEFIGEVTATVSLMF